MRTKIIIKAVAFEIYLKYKNDKINFIFFTFNNNN